VELAEDAMMRRLVPLIVTLLSLACGNEPTSPSSSLQLPTGPPLPTGVPNGPPVTMRGEVWDATHLPISGAQVQVVAPSRGPVAVTDGNGQFLTPWPFTGTVTVRAYSPSSFRIAGLATEMFTRSTYATKYIRRKTNRMRCLTFSADRRALPIMFVFTLCNQHDIPRVFSLQRASGDDLVM